MVQNIFMLKQKLKTLNVTKNLISFHKMTLRNTQITQVTVLMIWLHLSLTLHLMLLKNYLWLQICKERVMFFLILHSKVSIKGLILWLILMLMGFLISFKVSILFAINRSASNWDYKDLYLKHRSKTTIFKIYLRNKRNLVKEVKRF